MRLDIEDFSKYMAEEGVQEEQSEESPETVALKRAYEAKIAALEKECQDLIQKVRSEGIEEGKEQARKECEEQIAKERQQCEERIAQSAHQLLEQEKERYTQLESELTKRLHTYFADVAKLLSQHMAEIFAFLYIREENAPLVVEKIEEILEHFSQMAPLKIKAGATLYPFLKERFSQIAIEEDGELGANDFVVVYEEFIIEKRIEQKLALLKDELQKALANPS